MIIYKYEKDGYEHEMVCGDGGPEIMKSNTGDEYAYGFVEYVLKPIITKLHNIEFTGKRVLDVGMGNGNVLRYVRELLGADVFGFDINDYLNYDNYCKGRTFTETDIRDIPNDLLGTFDIAYQRFFSVPFKDTSEVLLAISKALKSNGIYLVTFDDEQYTHDDAFVIKILNEIYNELTVKNNGRFIIASSPRANPVLTPMDSYYYVLSDKKFKKYISADLNEQKQILLTLKNKIKNPNFKSAKG